MRRFTILWERLIDVLPLHQPLRITSQPIRIIHAGIHIYMCAVGQ